MKKSKSHSPSPVDLPLNLWAEIFHKLSLVSVGRCLRVCKQWYRLISDPLFVSNYNPNSIPNHPISLLMQCYCGQWYIHDQVLWHLIFLNEASRNVSNEGVKCIAKSKSLERRPFRSHCDFFAEGERDRVMWLGLCNGLAALYKSRGDFILFNPCTKVEKRLQLDSDQSKEIDDHFFQYFTMYALYQYHDEAGGDEYKVVMCDYTSFRIVSLKDGSFTSKTQSHVLQTVKVWAIRYTGKGWQATMVRGVPHWAAELRVGGDVIIYFDPQAEELQMVRFPKARASVGPYCQPDRFELGALDGQLTVALELGKSFDYEVWALKEYGNEPSWSLLFVIPKACDSFQILSRVSDDEILVWGQFLKVYNIRTRRSRKVLFSNGLHKAMDYIPSLVSPNH